MTRSSKGNCGHCGTKRCLSCGRCPDIDCEAYVSCERPRSLLEALGIQPRSDEDEKRRAKLQRDLDAIREAELPAWKP